ITSISLDHVGILGDTVAKIAYEKGGIIKENGLVLVYDQSDEAKNVIKDICEEKNAKYIEVNFDDINIKKSDINSQVYDCTVIGKRYNDLEIQLIGDHQINNSILALSAIEILKELKHLNIDEDDIRRGLKNTKWPGRIEKILDRPTFIINVNNKKEEKNNINEEIKKNYNNNKLTIIICMLKKKNRYPVLKIIIKYINIVIKTTTEYVTTKKCVILPYIITKYLDNI